MIKHDLREQGYSEEEISPRQFKINMIWAIISVSMIVVTFVALILSIGYSPGDGGSPIDISLNPDGIPICIIEFLVAVFIYLALKFYITIALCKDRKHSIKLKILENKGMPVCQCKEALKIWQTLLIYILPFVGVYACMFILCMIPFDAIEEAFQSVDTGFMTMLFFMTFFFGFDLTVAAYVIYFKIKHKIDYISIDHHIYMVTIFKQTYVKFKRKSLAGKYTNKRNDKYLEDGKFKLK